jgi:hypothetical protein
MGQEMRRKEGLVVRQASLTTNFRSYTAAEHSDSTYFPQCHYWPWFPLGGYFSDLKDWITMWRKN